MEENMGEKNGAFFLKAKYLDIKTGHPWVVVINDQDAKTYGVRAGDELLLKWNHKQTEVGVDLTKELVLKGEIGLFKDITLRYKIKEGDILELSLTQPPPSLESIRKKLLGKKLTYEEIKGIMADIANYLLDDIQIAFFLASSFQKNGLSKEEIYYMTKAMAETGEMVYWNKEIVADKHSIGGVPGNCTTPIVVSIISNLNIFIPKTSSRAVTSEAGTADVIEAIAPVEFSLEKIKKIANEVNACLVWGGSLKLAPADDRILRVSYELGIEPYSKMIVSIMAKKAAMGATHLVIDMPIAEGAKISNFCEAKKVKKTFLYLSKKFNIRTKVIIEKISGPIGRGIGPALEIKDVLKVLEQKEDRPLDLEKRAIKLAGVLLELTKKAPVGKGETIALNQLKNGGALKQFKKIIEAQGGIKDISSDKISLGQINYEFKAEKEGIISKINLKELMRIARLLGSPSIKGAGVYLNKTIGEKISVQDTLFTLYTDSDQRLSLALNELAKIELYTIYEK